MKIRNGFVSNSSSSSFIVLLPVNFINNIDYDDITNGDEDYPLDILKEMIEEFVRDSVISQYDTDNVDGYYLYDDLTTIIKPYVIAEIEVGSDSGEIIVADSKKISEILELNKDEN